MSRNRKIVNTDKQSISQLQSQADKYVAISDLVKGVAHNFNNLLQAIMGGAQLARLHLNNQNLEGVNKSLDNILDACQSGAETVRRLQSFADIGRQDQQYSQVNVSSVLENAVEISKIWWKGDANRRSIKISVSCSIQPDCYAEVVENDLLEVLLNLTKNAMEALPVSGSVFVSCQQSRGTITIKIRDNGVGIASQDLNRIFNPLFSTKAAIGTGLGLAISQQIISDFNGKIFVNSKENEGTEFVIQLPAIKSENNSVKDFSNTKRTFLVIDDMKSVVAALSVQLEEFDQKVVSALSGSEGLDLLERYSIDCIICDYGMPEMNGAEVGKCVKDYCAQKGIEKIPFIILTGWGSRIKKNLDMKGSGIDFLLEKPINVEKIFESLSTLKKRRKLRG
jgi:CheY-like chemotaxis protein